MSQGKQLSARFNDALLSGKWVANTNYKEILSDVSFKEATSPYKNLHSIAMLTFHINYYIAGVLEVLKGKELCIRDRHSFDMPELQSKQEWEQLRTTLFKNAEEFSNYLTQLTDQKIEENFVDKKYGNYNRNINGMIEHCYYHLGQIVLIKKLLRA